jgi:hypothetical protein
MDDLEMSDEFRQRATVRLPEVPDLTPQELPDELAAQLLWELACESPRLMIAATVYRQDMYFTAQLKAAEWGFDKQGQRRWIPSGGMVTVELVNIDEAEQGTIKNLLTMFSGPVSPEEFIEQVVACAVELKSKYVLAELKKFK